MRVQLTVLNGGDGVVVKVGLDYPIRKYTHCGRVFTVFLPLRIATIIHFFFFFFLLSTNSFLPPFLLSPLLLSISFLFIHLNIYLPSIVSSFFVYFYLLSSKQRKKSAPNIKLNASWPNHLRILQDVDQGPRHFVFVADSSSPRRSFSSTPHP